MPILNRYSTGGWQQNRPRIANSHPGGAAAIWVSLPSFKAQRSFRRVRFNEPGSVSLPGDATFRLARQKQGR